MRTIVPECKAGGAAASTTTHSTLLSEVETNVNPGKSGIATFILGFRFQPRCTSAPGQEGRCDDFSVLSKSSMHTRSPLAKGRMLTNSGPAIALLLVNARKSRHDRYCRETDQANRCSSSSSYRTITQKRRSRGTSAIGSGCVHSSGSASYASGSSLRDSSSRHTSNPTILRPL
jgi:hypothetical protein